MSRLQHAKRTKKQTATGRVFKPSPNFSPSGEHLWTGTPKNDLQNQPPGSKFSSIQMESGYGNRKTNIEGRNRDRQL